MTSLAHGLPQLVLPQMADQFLNAERLAARGVAVYVPFEDRSAEAVHNGVRKLLANARYRNLAREVRREITAMPTAVEVVPILEHLAN